MTEDDLTATIARALELSFQYVENVPLDDQDRIKTVRSAGRAA